MCLVTFAAAVNSCRPYGTHWRFPVYPALTRWANEFRPFGADRDLWSQALNRKVAKKGRKGRGENQDPPIRISSRGLRSRRTLDRGADGIGQGPFDSGDHSLRESSPPLRVTGENETVAASLREAAVNSCRPYGTHWRFPVYPALTRWANEFPFGAAKRVLNATYKAQSSATSGDEFAVWAGNRDWHALCSLTLKRNWAMMHKPCEGLPLTQL